MNKREKYAKAAMQGILADPKSNFNVSTIAEYAFVVAEAMLKAGRPEKFSERPKEDAEVTYDRA